MKKFLFGFLLCTSFSSFATAHNCDIEDLEYHLANIENAVKVNSNNMENFFDYLNRASRVLKNAFISLDGYVVDVSSYNRNIVEDLNDIGLYAKEFGGAFNTIKEFKEEHISAMRKMLKECL